LQTDKIPAEGQKATKSDKNAVYTEGSFFARQKNLFFATLKMRARRGGLIVK
jgi:hypothetical protein